MNYLLFNSKSAASEGMKELTEILDQIYLDHGLC